MNEQLLLLEMRALRAYGIPWVPSLHEPLLFMSISQLGFDSFLHVEVSRSIWRSP